MTIQTIDVVLLGLDFKSGNLGCSALAYSFLQMLDIIGEKHNVFFKLLSVNYNSVKISGKRYELNDLPIHYKQLRFWRTFSRAVKKSSFVIDFTGGDSFTDLYGIVRFIKECTLKQYVLLKRRKLILGPQTIGPFSKSFCKFWAAHIVKKSSVVYTRDCISLEYSQESFGVTPILTTDIAFMLPVSDILFSIDDSKINIGINVSGLLWRGGYTGNNELGLKLNYKEFIVSLVSALSSCRDYKIHLISHVFESENPCEDDYYAASEVFKLFPNAILAPRFKSPMDAKKYISEMNFFIGSRMHATIAAFSTGVPVVSVAYSRKFKGLYDGLNYPYVIDAKEESNESAVERCLKWLNDSDKIKKCISEGRKIVNSENIAFIADLEKKIELAN